MSKECRRQNSYATPFNNSYDGVSFSGRNPAKTIQPGIPFRAIPTFFISRTPPAPRPGRTPRLPVAMPPAAVVRWD